MKRLILTLLVILNLVCYSANNYISKIAVDENGNILEGENIHIQHPQASITKLMNVLVIVDLIREGDISFEDMVTISSKAASIGGSKIELKKGEKTSLKDLFTATLVYSANNAAYAMAEYAAGTEEDFVRLMNMKAEKLGLEDTHYYTSMGLPSSMTEKKMDTSSAYDIAKLSVYILDYPEILEIASLKKTYIKNGKMRLFNRNKLLNDEKGIDGLKTGHHDRAGYNIVVTAKRNNFRIVSVVLGSPTEKLRDKETENLVNYIYSNYEKKKIISKGDFIINVKVNGGKESKIDLYALKDVEVIVNKNWKLDKTVYLPDNVFAPLQKDDKLGIYVIKHENIEIGKTELITKNKMKKGNWIDEIKKRFIKAKDLSLQN